MPLKILLIDPKTGQQAWVVDDSLLITLNPSPPLVVQKTRVFRQYLTDDGLAAGTSSMLIAAAAAPQDFWIPASSTADRYITTLSFVIADEGAKLNEFGHIAALTNGCQLIYQTQFEEVTIHDTLKSNWDFVRLCLGEPSFGNGGDAFKAKDVEGKVDAYIPVLDLRRLVPPYGIKLDMGTTQKLIMRVRDRTDEVDAFNCIAYGFDRFE